MGGVLLLEKNAAWTAIEAAILAQDAVLPPRWDDIDWESTMDNNVKLVTVSIVGSSDAPGHLYMVYSFIREWSRHLVSQVTPRPPPHQKKSPPSLWV